MQIWMISSNEKIFDCASAFEKWGFVDWTQHGNYQCGDIVYIYCTKPYQRVMYKTLVEKESMSLSEIVDDREFWKIDKVYGEKPKEKFVRLRWMAQADREELSLLHLKEHGLKSAPQGPVKVKDSLFQYIEPLLDDAYSEGIFPESTIPENSYEGAVQRVTVNKYERSSIARKKCIEYHGWNCAVCGMNFADVYGEIGEEFIHVHHIVPLNEIHREYRVDYKKDLIPVCPNCHAMLHRKLHGKSISVEQLQQIVKNIRNRR